MGDFRKQAEKLVEDDWLAIFGSGGCVLQSRMLWVQNEQKVVHVSARHLLTVAWFVVRGWGGWTGASVRRHNHNVSACFWPPSPPLCHYPPPPLPVLAISPWMDPPHVLAVHLIGNFECNRARLDSTRIFNRPRVASWLATDSTQSEPFP